MRNGHTVKEIVQDTTFIKTFEIGTHSVTIIQHGDKYELRIDNQSFSHMMDLERNRNFFSTNTNNSNTPTSSVLTNNFKLNTGAKPHTFGTGVINPNQGKDKPALFNFSIKPANQMNPNLANRKFGGPESSANDFNSNNKPNPNHNVGNSNGQSINNSAQPNQTSNVNLLDLNDNNSNPSNKGTNTGVNLLGEVNLGQQVSIAGTNNDTGSAPANNNRNLLDPFDIINSLANNQVSNTNTNAVNIANNSNFNPQPNNDVNIFMGYNDPNKQNEKAQNLLDAMFSANNNNPNNPLNSQNFVDFSKQNNNNNNNFNNQNNYNFNSPTGVGGINYGMMGQQGIIMNNGNNNNNNMFNNNETNNSNMMYR